MNHSKATPLKTTTNYALHIMAILSGRGCEAKTILSMKDEVGISQSYMEQVMGKLKNALIVKGSRGPGGGYGLVNRSTYDVDERGVHTSIKRYWTAWDVVLAMQPEINQESDNWLMACVLEELKEGLKQVVFK